MNEIDLHDVTALIQNQPRNKEKLQNWIQSAKGRDLNSIAFFSFTGEKKVIT